MQPRTLAFATVGIFALCSSSALAQGHGGDSYQGGDTVAYRSGGGTDGDRSMSSGGGYRGSSYGSGQGYRPGYYRGSGGDHGWYGPSVGIYLGAPWYWGLGGMSSYPDYANAGGYGTGYVEYPVVDVGAYQSYAPLAAPPTYVAQAPASSNYWYYCADPAGYYPQIQQCNNAWMPIAPQNVPPVPPSR